MEQGLPERLKKVQDAIAQAERDCGRGPGEVGLVAVSKLHPARAVRQAFSAGQEVFGESYAQEGRDKMAELADIPVRWHYIGGLQTNKAKYVAGSYELVHSVDSVKLARALAKEAAKRETVQEVLLQVNLACEEQKCGTAEEEAPRVAEEIMELGGLGLAGLMIMPPWSEDPEASRKYFAGLRELRDRLEARLGAKLPHLSMGMSHDFAVAVQEGATLVRVGTAIFGERPCRAKAG